MAFDAAMVFPPMVFVYAAATVPLLVVSVSVAATDLCRMPAVVQAGALMLPLNVRLVPESVSPPVSVPPASARYGDEAWEGVSYPDKGGRSVGTMEGR